MHEPAARAVQGPHPTLARTFAQLDGQDVRWCILREAGPGSEGDVDLLVHPADLMAVLGALAPLSYAPLPTWGRGSHRFFLGYDPDHDVWTKLDIVTELAFGHHFIMRTSAAPGVLGRRLLQDGRWVLAAQDRFWSLLLHCVLDRHSLANGHAERLLALVDEATTTDELAAWFDAEAPPGWNAARVLESVREGRWQELAALGRVMESAWLRRHGLSAAPRLLARATLRRATKLLTLLHRRGVAIAVLGPDGAGKSTLARELERSFHMPVRSVYMGLYSQAGGPRRRLGLLGRLIRLWSRYLVGVYHRSRGRLVVFDRYAYDALLPAGRAMNARRRMRRWLLAHACPPPDLVVVLDAPGEVLFRRAGEHDAEVLERQRQGYRELGRRLREVRVLDATMDADALRREVTALVWDRYVDRARR